MTVLETPRLRLRWVTAADAAFILELLNDPGWLQYIGDRNVRTLDDARRYIAEKLTASYERHGFGLNLVVEKASDAPTGLCGLIKRDHLEDVDVGFAFLPTYRGGGYASEAGAAVIEHGRTALGITRVVGVTVPGNVASIRVLEKLGLEFERMVMWPGDGEELALYGRDLGEEGACR